MKKCAFVFILLFFIASSLQAQAQAQHVRFQAVFIYNFTKYVKWPSSYKSGNFEIGVLGASSITNELKTKLEGKKQVGSQRIKIKQYSSVASLGRCHILFIPKRSSGQIRSVLSKLSGKSTLIITESPGMITKGAVINFTFQGVKVGFELNVREARKRNFRIDPALIRLAKNVIQ